MTYSDEDSVSRVVGDDHVGTRLLNALGRMNVMTVGQLKKVSDRDVSDQRNVGAATMHRLAEVRKQIS